MYNVYGYGDIFKEFKEKCVPRELNGVAYTVK